MRSPSGSARRPTPPTPCLRHCTARLTGTPTAHRRSASTRAMSTQARAAGVLIEFEHGTPMITYKALYRELAKQAIERTLQQRPIPKQEADSQRASRTQEGGRERTPSEQRDSEHRANLRALTERAHGTNLDLGAALLNKLAVVDPGDMDVARFFAYGLLGPDSLSAPRRRRPRRCDDRRERHPPRHRRAPHHQHTPRSRAEHPGRPRSPTDRLRTPRRGCGSSSTAPAAPASCTGRTLVVFAAQHYAHNLVLPTSQRRGSVIPALAQGRRPQDIRADHQRTPARLAHRATP